MPVSCFYLCFYLCVTTKEKIERPAVLSSQNSARGPMKFGGISGINDTKLGEGREREREREREIRAGTLCCK